MRCEFLMMVNKITPSVIKINGYKFQHSKLNDIITLLIKLKQIKNRF